MQFFYESFRIVSRALTGKLHLNAAKESFIVEEVAFNLCQLARDFQSLQLSKGDVENADETHFHINMENSRTLRFRGDKMVA